VQRLHRNHHLPLKADRLARRRQARFEETVEALFVVPDFDDPKAGLERRGEMQVDAWLGALFDAQFIHDGAILQRVRPAMSNVDTTVMRSPSFPWNSTHPSIGRASWCNA
jgi:hypothetical protein